jgi:hypothetical protein
MNEFTELLQECNELNNTPILTQEELSAIDDAAQTIDGLEWPYMLEGAEEFGLDPNMEVKPEEAKGFLMSMVLKTVEKFKQKPEALDKIVKKAAELKNSGIDNAKEMYDNIMKDTPFLNVFVQITGDSIEKEISATGKAIKKAGWKNFIQPIAIIAVMFIMLTVIDGPKKALSTVSKEIIPIVIRHVKGMVKWFAVLSSIGVGAKLYHAGKLLGIKNILKDLVKLIKGFNISDLKNKFRNYEVMDTEPVKPKALPKPEK